MLSKEQKKEYVDKRGLYCPHCGSHNIEETSNGVHRHWDMEPSVEVHCCDCRQEWRDIYTLTDVE